VTRRILTIIVAIVLAVIGTGAVLIYVNQANARALSGQKAVTVLVANHEIPAGTSASTALADGLLAKQKLPAASVPSDAVSSITADLAGLVVSANVPSGELLLRPMLVTSVVGSSGLAIPQGMVAVTIPLCVPQAVAGFVYPQSQVAIFDTVFGKGHQGQASCSSSGGGGNTTGTRTRIVLSKVTVLAVGTAGSASTSPTGSVTATGIFSSSSSGSSTSDPSPQGSVLVTLAVSQNDAERVITLAEAGTPWLALLSNSSVTGPDVSSLPLFPGFK
jgi:pilus assembly protein CpaB